VVGFKPHGKILYGPRNKKLVEAQSRFGLFWRKKKCMTLGQELNNDSSVDQPVA